MTLRGELVTPAVSSSEPVFRRGLAGPVSGYYTGVSFEPQRFAEVV